MPIGASEKTKQHSIHSLHLITRDCGRLGQLKLCEMKSKTVDYSQFFECIFESLPIWVPSLAELNSYIRDKWSEFHRLQGLKMGTPSERLQTGTYLKYKVFSFKQKPIFEQSIEFASEEGAYLPNIYGLGALLRVTANKDLPKGKVLLGLDYQDTFADDWVPAYRNLSEDEGHYIYQGWNDDDPNNCFVLVYELTGAECALQKQRTKIEKFSAECLGIEHIDWYRLEMPKSELEVMNILEFVPDSFSFEDIFKLYDEKYPQGKLYRNYPNLDQAIKEQQERRKGDYLFLRTKGMNLKELDFFTSVHSYNDLSKDGKAYMIPKELLIAEFRNQYEGFSISVNHILLYAVDINGFLFQFQNCRVCEYNNLVLIESQKSGTQEFHRKESKSYQIDHQPAPIVLPLKGFPKFVQHKIVDGYGQMVIH